MTVLQDFVPDVLDVEEYWDPSDPNVPDPVEDLIWRDWSVMEEIAHLERAKAQFFGSQLVHVAAYVADKLAHAEAVAAADCRELGLAGSKATFRRLDEMEHARRSAHAQLGLMLGIGRQSAEGLATTAAAFVDRCPATLAALAVGRITQRKAEILLDQTANLSPDLQAEVEQKCLAAADGRTEETFRDKVRRIVEKADATAVRRRAERARKERRVELWPDRDGMWALHAVLAPEDAHAAYGLIDAWAQAAKKAREPGDERGIDALRADALMDLLRDPCGADRIGFQVKVVVPLGTVLGLGDEPGFIPGHGPIPAEVCRRIAADNAWKRLLTDPNTGHLLDAGAATYKPSRRLVDFVRSRDQRCRWPGCRRKAHRSDVDHTVAFNTGGRTVRINLGCLCMFHHGIKHLPGWSCTQDPDGTLTFTTPEGRIYRTRPPTVEGEEHPTETVEDESFPF